MKLDSLFALALVATLTGCATGPETPQEYAERRRQAAVMMQMGRVMQGPPTLNCTSNHYGQTTQTTCRQD